MAAEDVKHCGFCRQIRRRRDSNIPRISFTLAVWIIWGMPKTIAESDSSTVPVVATVKACDPAFDGLVVVTDSVSSLPEGLKCTKRVLTEHGKIDSSCESDCSLISCDEVPHKRLIFAPTGPLNRDYDDVRRFADAAEEGIKRALKAGCRSPLLAVAKPNNCPFPMATRVAVLGALHALYVPIEVREMCPDKATKADKLGVWTDELDSAEFLATLTHILENGRRVYCDIGGSDPERMAAPNVAKYVENEFKDSCIKVNVISDVETLSKEYPLLAAVNRACSGVERHQARVIRLEYVGAGTIDKTLMIVGKGITYDTGGADVKVGGAMAGMHRDKCGAAYVAGFFKVLSMWQPKGLKVVGAMTMVRNSIGSESYVADEIIISRAGKRVRIGNTDAEGRMVMGDLLCQMKEEAANEVEPSLFTFATLTGHVCLALGEPYTGIMDNGPARKEKTAQTIQAVGETCGDMFELSTIRREDYKTHAGRTEMEDVIQSGGGPSTRTERGHQAPAAFLILASGLDKHGQDSEAPLKYTHVDIAGSSGPWPGIPTGAPIVAFSHHYVLNRDSSALKMPADQMNI